jgi:hypothetical protein
LNKKSCIIGNTSLLSDCSPYDWSSGKKDALRALGGAGVVRAPPLKAGKKTNAHLRSMGLLSGRQQIGGDRHSLLGGHNEASKRLSRL